MNEFILYNEMDFNNLLSNYNDKFINLFKFVYKHSKFYNNKYQLYGISLSDITDLSDLTKLPVISKSEVRNNSYSIHQGFKMFQSIGYTSGTTGSPLNIYRSPLNILTEQAYLRNYRSIFGYNIGSPLLSIRGALGKHSTHRFNKFTNVLYISSQNINSNTISFYYNLVKFACFCR